VPFNIDVERDPSGIPVRLVEDDPTTTREPITSAKRNMLAEAGAATTFLSSWNLSDWNTLRVRCVGARPVVTTWVNGQLIAKVETASFEYPGYDPDAVWNLLGPSGHLAFEVHDNDPGMGEGRWGRGAACRWRSIRIREV
jgi:hypothetical protein